MSSAEELSHLARVNAVEVALQEVMAAAQRVQWDSTLAAAIECKPPGRSGDAPCLSGSAFG
jgi:hypothetical protein